MNCGHSKQLIVAELFNIGMSKLSGGDVVVVIASLVGVIGIAIYSARKSKKNATDEHAESFFLAGRNMPWWICAASLFASNIGMSSSGSCVVS